MDHFQVFEKLQTAVGREETLRTRGKTDTQRSPLEQKQHQGGASAGGPGWGRLGSSSGSCCWTMLEENAPSRYVTRLTHPEDSQETKTAVSHVLRDQENTGQFPGDGSDSCASSGDLPANPSSPQHHLAELRMLMARQKAEYEAKLASLEQQNRALHLEVQGMHWKLGQQRKWHRLVEMRMRNAERAKEDAERRNETLQKEMEEFFETFGEINRWK